MFKWNVWTGVKELCRQATVLGGVDWRYSLLFCLRGPATYSEHNLNMDYAGLTLASCDPSFSTNLL